MSILQKLRPIVVLFCFIGFLSCWLIGVSDMAYREAIFDSGSKTPTLAQTIKLQNHGVARYVTTLQNKRLEILDSFQKYSFWAGFGFVAVLGVAGKRYSLLDKNGKL